MQYLGGKSRIAKQIAAVMLAATDERTTYIEPFVGAGSVAVQMVPHFKHAYLSDASPDLIALWRALQKGWEPPEVVTEEYYQALRNAAPSAVRGFVGYGCSFGGKWFGGYARDPKHGRNFARTAGSLLNERIDKLATADFYCLDYRDLLTVHDAIVYCDPPYRNATNYARLAEFDSDAFWSWAGRLSRYANVFVSEYTAPEGWQPVWSGTPRVTLRVDSKSPRPTERLWTYSPARSIPLAKAA